MNIITPDIEISPHWPHKNFEIYVNATSQLVALSQSAGIKSDAFKNAYNHLKKVVLNLGQEGLVNQITKNIEVRAMLHLLVNDQEVAKLIKIDNTLCNMFMMASPMFSTLTLLSAIQCYFTHFKYKSEDDSLGTLIKSQMIILENKLRDKELVKLNENKDLIFSCAGPQKIVKLANELELKFSSFIKGMGFSNYDTTRYVKRCRGIYYLSSLKLLPKKTQDSLLAEIQNPDVFEAPYEDGRMIGHEVISIILEKFQSETLIPENWMEIILKIAGDPRVPKSSSLYQRWWIFFSDTQIDQVLAALSGVDLDLFLTALKDYADKSSDLDLKRMFVAREKFLRGLLEQNLIKKSRMFLGKEAEAYIKRNYDKEKSPNFSFLKERSKSIIYLDLGFCELLEGSHNCKFRLYDQLPPQNKLCDYSKKSFSYQELTSGLEQLYWDLWSKSNHNWGHRDFPVSVVHSSSVSWQTKIIAAMNDLSPKPIKPEFLFSSTDYNKYKMSHWRSY